MKHGIEQELQIIDPNNLFLVHGRVDEVLEKIRDGCRKSPFLDFGRDAYTSQLEYWIGVFDDLLVLGKKLSDFRRIAWQAAEELDLSLMACGVNPISETKSSAENFGEHHHIGVNSAKEALQLHNFVRLFIPELIALSTNSRFYDGRDTQQASFRLSRSRHCQLPPILDKTSQHKVRWLSHAADPGKDRMWDVTPFVKFGRQTVEVRLFDVAPTITRSLTFACLLQGLYAKLKTDSRLERILNSSNALSARNLNINRDAAIQNGKNAEFDRTDHPLSHFNHNGKISAVDAVHQFTDWLQHDLNKIHHPLLVDIVKAEIKSWSKENVDRNETTALDWAKRFYWLTDTQNQNLPQLEGPPGGSGPLNIGKGYCLDDGHALKRSTASMAVLECPLCGRLHPDQDRGIAFNAIAIDTLSCSCGSANFEDERGDLWKCQSCGKYQFISFYTPTAQRTLKHETACWHHKGCVSLTQSDTTIRRLATSRSNPNQLGVLTNDGKFILCEIDPVKSQAHETALREFDQAEDVKCITADQFAVFNRYGSDPVCIYDSTGRKTSSMVCGQILHDCGFIRLAVDDLDMLIAIGSGPSGHLKLYCQHSDGQVECTLQIACEEILASASASLGCGGDILLLTRRKGVLCIHRKARNLIWSSLKTGNWKDLAAHPLLDFTAVTDFDNRAVIFIENGGRVSDHRMQLTYIPFAIDFTADGNTLYISEFERPVIHFYQREAERKSTYDRSGIGKKE
jgi:gamma-glutamyl:cysteine ligase YbdK (ATP-grasp superfamily)